MFGSAGPQYTDVYQGGLGDCYYLSSLANVAKATPAAITSMFIVNGDGTYTVRLYANGKADYVTVNTQLPVDSSGRFVFASMGDLASNKSNVLWVALAEKPSSNGMRVAWKGKAPRPMHPINTLRSPAAMAVWR